MKLLTGNVELLKPNQPGSLLEDGGAAGQQVWRFSVFVEGTGDYHDLENTAQFNVFML